MPTESTLIRAVLFDLDDTLNDRSRSWMAYVHLLTNSETGLLGPCAADEVHRLIINADQGGYRQKDELFGELCERLPWRERPTAIQLEAHWRKHFCQCMVTREGVVDVLQALRAAHLRLGIVTNGRSDSQNAKIDSMGLRPLVDVIVVSETAGVKKPSAGIYLLALETLGVSASETLFVGDNPRLDVWGPSQLGMRTAWLDTGRLYPTDVARADYGFRAFPEFCSAVGLGNPE